VIVFAGLSGPGKLYLASPYVVAASAIAGKIIEPFEFLREPEPELAEA
jgi:3-isopropylmalate/(R)-2-methylmalate dehydratase large subunit